MRYFGGALVLLLVSIGAWAQFAPGPASWSPTALTPSPQVWSATQKNSNVSGGGTTTVTLNTAGGSNYIVYGTDSFTSGKIYFEAKLSGAQPSIGIGNTSSPVADGGYLGEGADSIGIYVVSTRLELYWNDGGRQWATGNIAAAGDVLGLAVDLTANRLWVKDVTTNTGWYGNSGLTPGDPVAGTGGWDITQGGSGTVISHPVVPGITMTSPNGETGIGYFSQSSWTGTAPAGFGQSP